MTDPSEANRAERPTPAKRCASCGHLADELVDGCCTLCGHRVVQRDVTAEDHTPYAQAREAGNRAWGAMCGWVYGAGTQRLMHLGLSRSSRASRRFFHTNLALFALAVLIAVFANSGWHLTTHRPTLQDSPSVPTGKGWWQCLAGSAEPERGAPGRHPADLWWNVPLAVLTAVAALIATFVVGMVLLGLIGAGSRRALGDAHGGGQRLSGALHYSSAWLHFVGLAALVASLRSVITVLHTAGWCRNLSVRVIDIPVVLLGLSGVLLWWFWLVRLAETSPRERRRRVSRFVVVWVPPLVITIVGAVAFGLRCGMNHLAAALNLTW